jgi:hypothetical protein
LLKNTNASSVRDAEIAKREAAAKAAVAKREKDRHDLEKQRCRSTSALCDVPG